MMKEKVLINTPIHYWTNESESTKAIIFIHPAFADHTCFDEQIHYFNCYKIITFDLIGHGKSLGKGTMEETADYINQMLEVEKIDKINLVGVSIGAVFAQDFANKYGNRVSSLVCIGGYDINNFDVSKQKTNSKAQIKMMLKAMFSIKWFAKSNKKISAFTSNAQTDFYNLNIQFKKKSFMYLAGLQKLVNKYPKKQRQYKLLVGCGEHDIPFEIELVNEWADYEKCDKIIFEGAGHCVNMDTPQKFNECLEKFLQSSNK